MKVRLHRDSLRLRLTPDDVGRLTKTGEVREATRFGADNEFACTLRLSETTDFPRAAFAAGGITVELPKAAAIDWADGDAVGIRHEQSTGDSRWLVILVEKDFECLESAGEADAETYFPNPKRAC
jgi:hypothetical protein